MAQDETPEPSATASGSSSSSSAAAAAPAARLNAAAPEFTPRSTAQHHGSNPHRRGSHHYQQHHHQPHHHHHNHHVPQQHYQPRHQQHHQGGEDEGSAAAAGEDKEGPAGAGQAQQPRLNDADARKVVKQVEFYFSDINLATTEHLIKFITNDPDGFVPISVVASFRKIREIVSDRSLLVAALRTSSELVVSEDGKKVKRLRPFNTEEVQSRIVVAENLPDQKYQTLMKIFSDVGSVKSIRTCYPQDGAAAAASKTSRIEMLFANKLHAFVEYGTVEDAEKAVAFSGEGKWRDGAIRVRSLLACLKHELGQGRRGGDEYAADEDGPDTTGHSHDYGADDTTQISEAHLEHQAEDGYYDKGMRQGRGRGRGGRGRGRGQYYSHSRDAHHPIGTPPSEHPAIPKPPPGPRMPDGTRGFTMGRGKPLNPTPDAAPITDAASITDAA
ncbi:la-related protein 6B-like isoform X1 [Panicum virgatum]|nr:la-related protein 6B-like isoform X1 [Panicum virgatum]